MDVIEIIRGVGEAISAGATVRSVYGEPVTAGERTILPVANVRFAFGGGGGDSSRRGGGGGGGGRVVARPAGFVEITPEGARFVYYRQPLELAAAVAAGFLLGLAIGRFNRK